MATRQTTPAPQAPAKPYHHGALREGLLEAAELILERDGIAGLTLRAAAREAGASHAAPKNHFGDLSGLLSELAAVGYGRLAGRMQAAIADKTTPQTRLTAAGRAYVEFAIAEPGLFQLMFRGERLDTKRPALRDAMAAAYGTLADNIAAAWPTEASATPSPHGAMIAKAWSMVHGYAMLLLDRRLTPLLDAEGESQDPLALLDAMLALDQR